MATKTVRAFTCDAPIKRTVKDASLPAQKTLVASFHGTGFVAEREGEDLKIFMVSADHVSTQTIGDRGWMTPAKLQALNVAHRKAEALK